MNESKQCFRCKGSGQKYYSQTQEIDYCPVCDGAGEIEMTDQEQHLEDIDKQIIDADLRNDQAKLDDL